MCPGRTIDIYMAYKIVVDSGGCWEMGDGVIDYRLFGNEKGGVDQHTAR